MRRNNRNNTEQIEERVVAVEISAEQLREDVAHHGNKTTEQLAELRGLSQNGVIWAGTIRLDSTGYADLQLNVPCGGVVVEYQPLLVVGWLIVTNQASGPGAQPNITGNDDAARHPGIFRIGANLSRNLPLNTATLGLYGAAGAFCYVEVRSRSLEPSAA